MLVVKILCDSFGRLIIFSTCLYYLGSGNFSTFYTLAWFYSMVVSLMIFYSIFNDNNSFSIENVIGEITITFIILFCPIYSLTSGIFLNGFASVVTFSNWDVVNMFEVITKGKKAEKTKKLHQPTFTKQVVYYCLIFGGYFG